MIARTRQDVSTDALTKQAIVEALWKRVADDATGTSEPALQRYGGPKPEARFWLGKLHPECEVAPPDDSRGDDNDFAERFKPASQGFSFRLVRLPVELEVSASFAVWVLLHPTLDEQRRRVGVEDDDATSGGAVQAHTKGSGRQLARVFTKVPVEDIRFKVWLDGKGYGKYGNAEFRDALRRSLDRVKNTFETYRPAKPNGRNPTDDDMADAAAWGRWEKNNSADPVVPDWDVRVDAEVRGADDGAAEVLLTIVNQTAAPEEQPLHGVRATHFPKWALDPKIYEVRLSCRPSVATIPYDLEQVPNSYRYDRKVPVLGINTAAAEEGGRFDTGFVAVARTDRVYPRVQAPDGTAFDVSFARLKDDPLPELDKLVSWFERWTDENWSDGALDHMASEAGWVPETRHQAGEDAKAAREEVGWVKEGLDLLHSDTDMLQAFKLMNETAVLSSQGKGYSTWRPFQLAYVLGCLPGLKHKSPDAPVDILWFNTGGGKTEAYLGLNVVAMFYGRLTGRTGGTQTWARFPLRLLSLQQTQRMAESVIAAEVVRREHKGVAELRGGEPFGIGYYVGERNTPNVIELPGAKFYEGWDPFDPATVETCRVLEVCPACKTGARPKLQFDKDSHTLEHLCSNPRCDFSSERLPVYVIDDDIYRRAPTVVVGTVDKLAAVSQNRNFRILLGGALSSCPKHGYSVQANSCSKWGCTEPSRAVSRGFGGMELEIQDELHLLKESLGALDGNYETLFQHVAMEVGVPAVRVIGATATIEGYEEQADQLYRRKARRFPLPGPTKEESFWAYEVEGDPLRTYVAMLPRGTTMLNAGYFVALSHRRFYKEAMNDTARFCRDTPGLDESQATEVHSNLRECYEVMVSYSLRKRDLERHATDVTSDPEICPHEQNYDSITGDVQFGSVRDVLNRLEYPPPEDKDRVWLLGATSAIAHGVDVNRMNAMMMMGMPQQTSEYIQATARVGRRHPAVLFSLINPTRRRDVSHFRYFSKYAEYLDRLVEPVPINREALPILKRVLPGGFMSLLLQVNEPEWLFPGGSATTYKRRRLFHLIGVIAAIDKGELKADDFVRRLLKAFAVPENDPQFDVHRRTVERYVDDLFDLFLSKRGEGEKERTADHMDPPPPTSLRDVERNITIRGER